MYATPSRSSGSGCRASEASGFGEDYHAAIPTTLVLLAALFLVTYVPAISLALLGGG